MTLGEMEREREGALIGPRMKHSKMIPCYRTADSECDDVGRYLRLECSREIKNIRANRFARPIEYRGRTTPAGSDIYPLYCDVDCPWKCATLARVIAGSVVRIT